MITPPYTDNLIYLCEKCDLMKNIDEMKLKFIKTLQPLNIEARYPGYKNNLYKELSKKKVEDILKETKIFVKWIRNML